MIIDTETHLIYRMWPIEANPELSRVFRLTWHEHSGALLVDEMDRANVDHAIVISYDGSDLSGPFKKTGSTPEDFVGGRKYTLASVREYPSRLLWFATLRDPRLDTSLRRMRTDVADGAYGFKIFPALFPLTLVDPALMSVYKVCANEDRRLIISFENTAPPNTPSVVEYLQQLPKLLRAFPDLRVQLNHGACIDPLDANVDEVARAVEGYDNVFLSTSYLGLVWEDESEYPFPRYLERLRKLKEHVGAEKIMWGTDWPWPESWLKYPQAVDAVRKHASFMSQSEKRLFLGENAQRFLGERLPGEAKRRNGQLPPM
jgi:predicted TIM-barrel fold metal-dependent hydrolase